MDKCPNCGYCRHCGRSDASQTTKITWQPYLNQPNWFQNVGCAGVIPQGTWVSGELGSLAGVMFK